MDRILLIDPDDRVADLMGRALTKRGHIVDRITGASRAADLAVAGAYGLVILDLILPAGVEGKAVLRSIQAQRGDRKVFVVSGRNSVADRVECLEAGAVDFLSRPFDLNEFLARVDLRFFESRPRGPGRTVSGVSLTLDPGERKVRWGGTWIPLTDREYRLLSHLLGSGQRPCSRAELLTTVWGITDDAGTNSHVDMYVHKLRRKLGKDIICTVRGKGYRVNVSTTAPKDLQLATIP